MTYPSTRQLNFSYDSIGRPSAVTGYVSNTGYDIAGQMTGDALGNGVTEQFGYDSNTLQLTSQKAGTASPYTNRVDLTYGYSAFARQMGPGSTAGNAGQVMSNSGTGRAGPAILRFFLSSTLSVKVLHRSFVFFRGFTRIRRP